MTDEDILRMAREADPFGEDGRLYAIADLTPKTLARFAALVAAAERESRQAAQLQVAELQERLNRADAERCAAILAEREECAQVCESYANPKALPSDPLAAWCQGSIDCADAIRARGKP